MQIYDIHVQDAQRLPPQEFLKEKFQTNCYHYIHVLQISVLLRAKGTIILVCTAHIYRIKYLSAIYVPANLTKDTQEIRTCYF